MLRVTDIGCNTGAFSRIAAEAAGTVISLDSDMPSVNGLYQAHIPNCYPLIADMTNPTPALGWGLAERTSLAKRMGSDTVLALALIHHLALAKNVPLAFIRDQLAQLTGRYLIIEFIPKEDPKAQLLLARKGDIFPDYRQAHFEQLFSEAFHMVQRRPLQGSGRMLYLFRKMA